MFWKQRQTYARLFKSFQDACSLLCSPTTILNTSRTLRRHHIYIRTQKKHERSSETWEDEATLHLAIVIKPAGMNFPELKNLSPITPARLVAVPDMSPLGGRGRVISNSYREICWVWTELTELAHRVTARRSWDFETSDKCQPPPAGQTGGLQPEKSRCLWRKHRFEILIGEILLF